MERFEIHKSKFHVGCAGWSYSDWKGNFYPKNSIQQIFSITMQNILIQ